MGAARRRLWVDESLNPRIAVDLWHRGRINAKSVQKVPDLRGMKDPELLRAIAASDPGCVLLTADDNMPATHADVLLETGVSLAIVDPMRPAEFSPDEWSFEVIQRWAHKIEGQPPGTVRRYTTAGARVWKVRKRPVKIRA